jgi:hypothetical protein
MTTVPVALKFFKRLDFIIDQDYLDLVNGFINTEDKNLWRFTPIDHYSPEDVNWAISREIP